MMQKNKNDEDSIQKNIEDTYRGTRGGIFANKTRRRILGSGLSKRYRTESIFWSEITKYIKPSLLDLELFIKNADDKYVDEVLNWITLSPVVQSLLSKGNAVPTKVKAELAQLFIMAGFNCLLQGREVPDSLKNNIDRALKDSNFLVQTLGGQQRFGGFDLKDYRM